MLQHAKGNLIDMALEGQFHVIVHGCNCFNAMGGGIAKEIARRLPRAYEADCETIRGDRNKLGTYTVMLGKRFNVINAYTQYSISRGEDVFEYDAFRTILNKLAEEYKGCSFGFPLIGCGLAGGDKTVIMAMIEEFAEKVAKHNGIVTLVEFA